MHRFARHKVASNLLMIIMILAGVWALTKLNTQFLPNFALEFITVQTVWRGAAAEDVETSITIPIEQELRNLAGVKKMTSTSAMSLSFINLEYEQGSDMGVALDQVKEAVALLRNLPSTAEKPEISKAVHYELIARLLISGPEDPNELRHLARKMEHELLERGIAKVDISGLPKEEIAIQIPGAVLEELGLTLGRAAEKIAAVSHDLPAGSVGRDDIARQLRSLGQLRDEAAFADIPLLADKSKLLRLGDVARIERRYRQGELRISYQGKPAVELNLFRAEHNDALKTAQIVETWLAETRPQMPPGVKLRLYDEVWKLIDGRIMLLLKNGLGGLALVVLILYLFLNGRVAGW
ncbi:MAG: efflux RND transporter permease subunit, partial [Gammaproteobacteria bacterium]|nr:efflux RND transporter permease subunit [Gammaproteobacteria bacterium]